MNKSQFFAVALKLFSFLLFLRSIEYVLQLVLMMTVKGEKEIMSLFQVSSIGNILLVVMIVLYGLLGYIFLVHADKIAQKLVPGKTESIASKETILELVLSLIGLNIIISNTVYIIRLGTNLLMYSGNSINPFPLSVGLIQIGITVLYVIMGVFMVKYSSRFSTFLISKIPSQFWPQ